MYVTGLGDKSEAEANAIKMRSLGQERARVGAGAAAQIIQDESDITISSSDEYYDETSPREMQTDSD